jgi:hypothetical protein
MLAAAGMTTATALVPTGMHGQVVLVLLARLGFACACMQSLV